MDHLSFDEFRKTLMDLVYHLGRGHSSPAILPFNFLMSTIRDSGFKVVLDGQGADEILSGYKHYYWFVGLTYLTKLQFVKLLNFIAAVGPMSFVKSFPLFIKFILPKHFLRIAHIFLSSRILLINNFKDADLPVFTETVLEKKKFSIYKWYLKKMHLIGLKNLLYYSDIVAMKNSIENRSPFMDFRLVEYAFRSPMEFAVSGNDNKTVLREYLEENNLNSLITPGKSGFTTTLSDEFVDKMISELSCSEILYTYTRFARLKAPNAKVQLSRLSHRSLFRLYQVHLHHLLFFTSSDEA